MCIFVFIIIVFLCSLLNFVRLSYVYLFICIHLLSLVKIVFIYKCESLNYKSRKSVMENVTHPSVHIVL